MDKKTSEYFNDIIKQSQDIFENIEYNSDSTPERAILNIQAEYGLHRIFITELFSDNIRKYRYYILDENYIEAGFDNAPDPRAIRLKYGKIGKEHAGKNVCHLHLENKTRIELTEAMSFFDFIKWLQLNINKKTPYRVNNTKSAN